MAKRVDSGAGGQGLWRDLQTTVGSKKTHAGNKKSATKPQVKITKRKAA